MAKPLLPDSLWKRIEPLLPREESERHIHAGRIICTSEPASNQARASDGRNPGWKGSPAGLSSKIRTRTPGAGSIWRPCTKRWSATFVRHSFSCLVTFEHSAVACRPVLCALTLVSPSVACIPFLVIPSRPATLARPPAERVRARVAAAARTRGGASRKAPVHKAWGSRNRPRAARQLTADSR